MLHFLDQHGDPVLLNLTDEDMLCDGSPITPDVEKAMRKLYLLRPNAKLDSGLLGVADFAFNEGVMLSPLNILRTKRPLHGGVCTYFNNLSNFGLLLRERLEEEDTFKFKERIKQAGQAGYMMERLIGLFSMCTFGIEDPEDVPVELVQAVVDYLRTSDGLKWKEELFGRSPNNKQCVSQFVLGLSRIYPEAELAAKARQYRKHIAGYSTWEAFQARQDPLAVELMEHFKAFEEDSLMDPSRAIVAVTYVANWLDDIAPGESLLELSKAKTQSVTFTEYMRRRTGGFSHHVLQAVRNARPFCSFVHERLEADSPRERLFPLVSEREVIALKNKADATGYAKPTTAVARPLPEKAHSMVRDILDEGETGFPGQSGLFDVMVNLNGNVKPMYCPVGVTLLRAAFDIPARMAGLKRLDSGEGDVMKFNADIMQWEINDSPLAGYWADAEGAPRQGFQGRGYARLIKDPLKDVTGFFLNTNKTAAPHEIPWENERLHKSFYDLRKWQAEFHPVTKPIGPDVYLDNEKTISKKTKSRMPEIFGLARMFPSPSRPAVGRIISTHELSRMWTGILKEAERRYNESDPDRPVQLVRQDPNGQWRARYGMHGLRVRGITDLRRSGMPLEIISKYIAGHSTLAMSAYYLKFTPTEIQSFLKLSAERAEHARQFIDDCIDMEVEDARLKTVSLFPATWEDALKSRSSFEFCSVDIGLCPWDCTRCDDGGPAARTDDDKTVFKRVPGDGRNCVLCRHFVTGPGFLVQLHLHGTNLLERRQHLAKEEERINGDVCNLERQYKEGQISKSLWLNKRDILQMEMLRVKDEQEVAESSIFKVEVLINLSVQLEEQNGAGDGMALLAADRSSIVEYMEVTPFERNVWLTAASRIYPVLTEPRVEEARNRYVDFMLHNSGFTPPRLMTTVTPEQCRTAMDLYSKLLIERVAASNLEELAAGDLTFRDVGLEAEMRQIFDQAVSGPLSAISPVSQRQTLLGNGRIV